MIKKRIDKSFFFAPKQKRTSGYDATDAHIVFNDAYGKAVCNLLGHGETAVTHERANVCVSAPKRAISLFGVNGVTRRK